MLAVINERQLTQAQEERLELEELAPDKFDPEISFKLNKHASNNTKENNFRYLTMEEVAALLAASKAPSVLPEKKQITQYETMPREMAERLVREHYEYLEKQKQKRKLEQETWDFLKTTESEVKTKSTTKRSKSTKT